MLGALPRIPRCRPQAFTHQRQPSRGDFYQLKACAGLASHGLRRNVQRAQALGRVKHVADQQQLIGPVALARCCKPSRTVLGPPTTAAPKKSTIAARSCGLHWRSRRDANIYLRLAAPACPVTGGRRDGRGSNRFAQTPRTDVPVRACMPTKKWRRGITKTLQKSACVRPKDELAVYPQSKRCIHWAIICVKREGLEITNPYATLHPACSPHPAVQSNMVYLLQLHSWLLPALCGRLINADC